MEKQQENFYRNAERMSDNQEAVDPQHVEWFPLKLTTTLLMFE
jgi:hypothetical protein